MTPFRGVLTAMVTPFADDRSLDLEGARRLAAYLVDNGSHGVVVAGTTGESPTLSDDEKVELLEAVLDEIGDDATVICGTGSNDTRHAANLTRRAAQAGAHGVLVVSPYYNKPTEAGLRAHFAEVSEAAGETPVALYNIPSRSVINMSPEFIGSLAAAFQNIVGLKQANNAEIGPIRGIQMLAGNDDVFTRCLREGGTGGILVASHVAGPKMREIFDAAAEDEHDRALGIDRELADVYAAIAVAPPASSIKAILSLRGLIGETQRLPMVPVEGREREVLEEIAKEERT
jgi:4-hydroxy-tetrahydrodipicolinate synthase